MSFYINAVRNSHSDLPPILSEDAVLYSDSDKLHILVFTGIIKRNNVEELNMENMMIFNNADFGEVRTVTVNGDPWIVGRDICKAFGDKNPNRSLGR